MFRRAFLCAIIAAAAPILASAQTVTAQPETQAAAPAPQLSPIEPQNDLERAFVAALDDASVRPVFRRRLLDSHVALVLTTREDNATPFTVEIHGGAQAGFVFTSAERVDSVMGPSTPRIVLTGRAALERLRGKNVIINARLMPMLTLEAEDVESYLEAPVPPALAGPAQ